MSRRTAILNKEPTNIPYFNAETKTWWINGQDTGIHTDCPLPTPSDETFIMINNG